MRIYDAYRFTRDPDDFTKFLVGLKLGYRRFIKEVVYKDMISEPGTEELGAYLDKIDKAKLGLGTSLLQFDVAAVGYQHDQMFFVQFFNVPESLIKPYINEKILLDAHYQDEQDAPEGMDPNEWQRRKDLWARIFEDGAPPIDTGLVFPFTTDHFISNVVLEVHREKFKGG